MHFTDSQIIPAAQAKVWAGLNDPNVLAKCISGCERFETTAPNEMSATVVVKFGPLKASFSGALKLHDVDAPNGARVVGHGSGGFVGSAKATAWVKLTPEGPEITRLDYRVEAEIGGKLAKLGGRLVDVAAKRLAGVFFGRFATEILRAQKA
jgi:carbon monoxide dehydrogenase subunit G